VGEKIELKEKLAAVDLNATDFWDEIDDEQRKSLKGEFFLLNRYISNVKTNNREHQEHFVLTVNEYFNKHWNTLQKHPKLLWRLLCLCSLRDGRVHYHEWIGNKKKTGSNKKSKFLEKMYPYKKYDELELLEKLMSDADCKKLAEQHGYDDAAIKQMFK
jgi:hypothetical protein